MRGSRLVLALALGLVPALWVATRIPAPAGSTRLELSDAETGRSIAARTLPEGEEVVLTWTNSLFGLMVTEVFVARTGMLELTRITFADPAGGEPPRVRPTDVEDLYQTGGAFQAEGLSRPVHRVVFRVGEIGDPRIRVGRDVVRLKQEVGFGGAVLLVARGPSLGEHLGAWARWLLAPSIHRAVDATGVYP
jgi:hypothetical protein